MKREDFQGERSPTMSFMGPDASGSILYPRIKERVGEVDQKINHDITCAEKQDDALNHGIIAVKNGV